MDLTETKGSELTVPCAQAMPVLSSPGNLPLDEDLVGLSEEQAQEQLASDRVSFASMARWGFAASGTPLL